MSDDRSSGNPSGKAPSVPPAEAAPQSSIPPPTDEIDSEWGADDDNPKAAAPTTGSSVPATRRSEPGPSSPPPASSRRPQAPTLPEPKRSRTLIGIAAPIVEPSKAPSRASEPSRSRTLIGIPVPTASTVPEPRRDRTLLGIAAPSDDRAPVTQPSESPIAAAVQDFLDDKPTSPAKPESQAEPQRANPVETKPADSKPPPVQPVATKPTESKPPATKPAVPPRVADEKRRSEAPASSAATSARLPDDAPRGSGSLWVALIAAAGLAGLGFWLLSSAPESAEPGPASPETQNEPVIATEAPPAVAPPAPAPEPAPAAPEPTPAPSATALAAPADSVPAAPPPSASAEPAPPATGTRTVIVKAKPAEAKFFRKGKQVSGSPMTVEVPPGEKRAFEVGLPGYVTRKVVVDGSKPEILVGLRPEGSSGAGASTPTSAPPKASF